MKKLFFISLVCSLFLPINFVLARTGDVSVSSITVDSQSGDNIGSFNSSQPLGDIFKAQKQMVFQVLRQAGIEPAELPVEIINQVMKPQTKNVKALVSFSKGITSMDKGNFADAKKAFSQAAKEDPDFALAGSLSEKMPDFNRDDVGNSSQQSNKPQQDKKENKKEEKQDKTKSENNDKGDNKKEDKANKKEDKKKKVVNLIKEKSKEEAQKKADKVAKNDDIKDFSKKEDEIKTLLANRFENSELTNQNEQNGDEGSNDGDDENQDQSIIKTYQQGEEQNLVTGSTFSGEEEASDNHGILAMAIGLLGKYSSQSATEPFEVISPPIVSGLFYPTKPLEENDPNDDTGLPSEGVTLKNVDNVTVSISQDGNNLSFTDGSNTNSSVDISSSDYHLYTTTSLTQESDYIDLGYVSNLGQWSDTSNVDNKYSFYGDRFYVISGTSPNPNADIVQTNTTHNYIGDVYGQIGTQPSTTWTAPEMASGTFSAQVNFGSSSIDFSYIDMSSTSYEASISSQSASINSNLTFSADNVTGQVGPTGSMATGTASIHGSFFGSDNSGIGGEFHIITTTSPYYAGGAFIGKSGQ